MQILIESSYTIRGEKCSNYHKFAAYSDNIETALINHLDFLIKNGSPYELTFKVKGT